MLILNECVAIAKRNPPNRLAVITYSYVGHASLATFRYRRALEAYLEGARLAKATGDWAMFSVIKHDMANLYLQTSAFEQAEEAAAEASQYLPASAAPTYRLPVILLRARLAGLRGDMDSAIARYREVIDESQQASNTSVLTKAWHNLGRAYLFRGRMADAEFALMEAFRARKLGRDPELAATYRNLGDVRLAQNRPLEALRMMENAVAEAPKARLHRLAEWNLLWGRAKAHRAMDRLDLALTDLRAAVAEIQDFGLEWLPADALRVTSEIAAQEVYAELVDVANEIYLAEQNPALLLESLQAAFAFRAFGLRAGPEFRAQIRQRMPPDYQEILRDLHEAYAIALATPDDENYRALRGLRLRLTELDAQAGLGAVPDFGRGNELAIQPHTALFLFHVGARTSWLWAGSSSGWELHRLPGQADLRRQVQRLRGATASREGPRTAGAEVFGVLLGSASAAIRDRPRWMLVLDEDLYDLPFAALVEHGQYLVERHSLRVLPGPWALATRKGPAWDGPFLGVGDPVYNAADPRRGSPQSSFWSSIRASIRTMSRPNAGSLELTRLPGTAQELDSCQKWWPHKILLLGNDSQVSRLGEALRARPSVIHLATHVLPSPQDSRESLLALSLTPDDKPEMVGPEWIAAREAQPKLVVMSGCRSGVGEVKSGEGLMGLTRAWLYAGAHSVLSTYWPTLDDSGSLLESFYRHWDRGRVVDAAEALRQAQLEALRSNGWKARPSNWAAYFLIGPPD